VEDFDNGQMTVNSDSADACVHVVADDRELAGGVIDAPRNLPGVVLDVRRLACGDYRVEDRLVVERKTLADFARSVVDARLFRQTVAMTRSSHRGILIIEADGTDLAATGLSREAMQGALITVGVFYGLAVLRSGGPGETAQLLLCLGRQARKYAHGGLTRPGYRPKGRRARQLFVLQGLPGVGPGRAAGLLDRFGSVQAVAAASAEELDAVPGIGEGIAARIRWALEPDDMENGSGHFPLAAAGQPTPSSTARQ
jgi:ERCC4-type nuclease